MLQYDSELNSISNKDYIILWPEHHTAVSYKYSLLYIEMSFKDTW